ncbi:MAG TPA: bifunctional ornithine acetyltransferase/N-acetylglutamate synthase, partial [Candidatus Limnocylindrales bacterium]|nr:bifunctional ornithine acetyltransferase/N-acetylglutamate synthase [Candidatus Limnocylindrales bacterium]
LPGVDRLAVLPAGFAAGAMAAGIKASGRPDLSVVRTTNGPAATAAVFTQHPFAAAPVRLSQANLRASAPAGDGGYGWAEAVVATSGCANAATGEPGLSDQHEVGRLLAQATGLAVEHTLHLSTGIIGTRLPLPTIAAGLAALVPAGLTETDEGWASVAVALRTTDSRTKLATTVIALPDIDGLTVRPVTISGCAKGVGMIHPGMATMLSVILTDASIEPALLHAILRPAAARTWNQLTVDGDTSTNDTVFVLASGAGGTAPVRAGSDAARQLGRAIEAIARDLARQQAADGEGATTLLTCQVSGATDAANARAIARSVVGSSLVKAAAHGRDPNWGRIAGAAGNGHLADAVVLRAAGLPAADAEARAGRPVTLDPASLRIAIAGHAVFDGSRGGPLSFDRAAARAAMDAPEILIRLDLGLGDGQGEAFGCDLTEEYVIENAEYTT